MKQHDTTDRRVQRTRRALRDALIAVILERGWDSTSIQTVCERADVGRSTFYTHFADKEELLLFGFDDLRKELRAASGASATPLGFARGLIEHAYEQRRLFRAVIGKRSGQAIQARFRQLVLGLVRDDLAPHTSARTLEPAAHFVAGAFVELLTWWIDTRDAPTASELEAMFHQMSGPAITALRR